MQKGTKLRSQMAEKSIRVKCAVAQVFQINETPTLSATCLEVTHPGSRSCFAKLVEDSMLLAHLWLLPRNRPDGWHERWNQQLASLKQHFHSS